MDARRFNELGLLKSRVRCDDAKLAAIEARLREMPELGAAFVERSARVPGTGRHLLCVHRTAPTADSCRWGAPAPGFDVGRVFVAVRPGCPQGLAREVMRVAKPTSLEDLELDRLRQTVLARAGVEDVEVMRGAPDPEAHQQPVIVSVDCQAAARDAPTSPGSQRRAERGCPAEARCPGQSVCHDDLQGCRVCACREPGYEVLDALLLLVFEVARSAR